MAEKKQIVTNVVDINPKEKKASLPCPKCFQHKTGPGIPHPCLESCKKENLVNLVLQKKEASSEQIVS